MKSPLLYLLFALTLFFGTTGSSSAQTDTAFLARVNTRLSAQSVTEKVYLHLNNSAFSFGDTIWYKAYVVIGSAHQLSALSGVLYVEFLNPQDSLISRQILHLQAGVSPGAIALQKTLKQGTYRIRAYTNYMRNAGAEYFYDHQILIGGTEPGAAKIVTLPKPDVQFLPEGGNLVEGVRSKVAVKAIGANGFGVNVSGTIVDNTGAEVTAFATRHLGMGVFAFTPQPGKTYMAKLTAQGNVTFNQSLPTPLAEGYTLAFNNSEKDSLFIKIAANEKLFLAQKNTPFYLVAHHNGKVIYNSAGSLKAQVFQSRVSKSVFPTGIITFTLFSQSGEALVERIVFIKNNDLLKLTIASSPQTPGLINLAVKDKQDQPALGTFSVAVVNESKIPVNDDAESGILSNLLLTEDLKGYVEQPGYYFNDANEQAAADLDLLMLTQGYRRFDWKQVLNDQSPAPVFQPEKTLAIAGNLKTTSGSPVSNGKVTLIGTEQHLIRDTMADAAGNFRFTGLSLTDTSTLVIKAKKENKNDDVKIALAQTDFPAISKMINPFMATDSLPAPAVAVLQQRYADYNQQQRQDRIKNGINLKQVTIKASKQAKPQDLSSSSNLHGGGNADQVIMGDKVSGCITLSDCLLGKAFGVAFTGGTPSNIRTGGTMSVIVDGVILDGGRLNDVNASDIYSIEVLRSGTARSIYGSSIDRGGALVITMKHGGDKQSGLIQKSIPGLMNFQFMGYTPAKYFYSPAYSVNDPVANQRTAIYWNAAIFTDEHGNASIKYNWPAKGNYRLIVEGIDANGNLGSKVYRYKIN